MRRTAWFVIALLLAGVLLPGTRSGAQDANPQATISALQTQVAALSTPQSTPPATPAAEDLAQSQISEGAPAEVNVELILDVSGSMGQLVDTGETRMEAAKRVLNDVLAVVPEQPGINIGLRIYGHEGDNSEAGRLVSCQSSELIVPVSGVDRAAIAQQVAPLVPTGWTPIGLSLERSAADFSTADTGATNAVVLVTDGLETCGGDPATAAAALLTGNENITTHVIGFALTPEEQQILENITSASGGKLLRADNVNELSAALFSVLEELDIVVGNGYLGGNAFSLIPAGAPGEVSVVGAGAPDPSSGSVPFVVRNNTDDAVYDVRVTATAKDPAGRILASGDDQGVRPFHIQPGTLGLGHIYFDGLTLPADTTFEFRVETRPLDDLRYSRTRDLEVAEASLFEDRIVGQIENPQDGTLEGMLGLTVTCFDLAGNPLRDYWDFIETNGLAPDELLPFQATLYGVRSPGCPAFLIAGNGPCESCSPIAIKAAGPQATSGVAQPASSSNPPTQGAPTDERSAAMLAQTPLPGYSDAALRYFRFTGGGLDNLAFIAYSILQFDTAELADAALEETASRYLAMRSEPLADLLPEQPPQLGNRAIAFSASSTDPTVDVKVGIVAVRVGDRIHFLIGSQMNSSPMPLMEEALAQGLLPTEHRARGVLTVSGLNAGVLWEVLPRPEDLPEGFSVDDEFVPKMFGPLALTDETASPEATPSGFAVG